jgi:hypothetical protein
MGQVFRSRPITWLAPTALAVVVLSACGRGPKLSKPEEEGALVDLGEVAADGPKLGAVSDVAYVYSAPRAGAPKLGYLHAGAQIARSEDSLKNDDCKAGWYKVRPRGFVCTDKSATTDMLHGTLSAMALAPNLGNPLPYVYARTASTTSLFDRKSDDGVAQTGKLAKNAGMAIVGSWTAPDESKEPQRLGMLMNGQFVRAEDLRAAEPSQFQGIALNDEVELPLGFVVKRGIRTWKLDGDAPEADEYLEYHQKLVLTGRFRTLGEERFWALSEGSWVRHKDVTVIRERNDFPDFVKEGQRWIDISVITGTAVLYEGKKPVYATLVSVGRDRVGDPKETASTERGTFEIVAKHITLREKNPLERKDGGAIYDRPWALELSNGQVVSGAFWHDRFGIEDTDGDVQLSPLDAAHLWKWATPALPEGWHSVRVDANAADKTRVIVRK